MTAGPKASHAAMALAAALDEAMRSSDWLRHADDHERRVCLLADAVLDVLHPMGPVHLPPSIEAGLSRDLRDRRIAAEFRGDNTAALASRHGLSRRQIYRIIARDRAARREAG